MIAAGRCVPYTIEDALGEISVSYTSETGTTYTASHHCLIFYNISHDLFHLHSFTYIPSPCILTSHHITGKKLVVLDTPVRKDKFIDALAVRMQEKLMPDEDEED